MSTLTTEEAVRAILSLIHSDLVDLTEDGYDPGQKLIDLSDQQFLSTGETVLIDVAWSVWRGGWGAHIGDLSKLDKGNVAAVLGVLRAYWVGTEKVLPERDEDEWADAFANSFPPEPDA